ncbi:lytic transglycosylase domain-containing protein [Dyella sp. GSA-30]|uniref:lytic transglycosylase domain-containing protein n=1 Tax=Dyella sp. GSA-30 TaxID=2994496 RepID=UPI0031F2F9C9
MEMMSCPNLSVPAEVMQHIVNVESGKNPYAIGVVGGQLVRQPQNLDEAIATAQMLESKGYNYSLGIAQVNRNNLGKYGIDSYEKAFDRCTNLQTGSRILADCYRSAGGDWGKSFSCYYSGNFVTGYRHGYVQKIYASMQGDTRVPTAPVPLADARQARVPSQAVSATNGAAYRVAIRSSALDTASVAATAAIHAALPAAATKPSSPTLSPPALPSSGVSDEGLFVPVVRGPNDPATPVPMAVAPAASAVTPNPQQHDTRDAAFVF